MRRDLEVAMRVRQIERESRERRDDRHDEEEERRVARYLSRRILVSDWEERGVKRAGQK